jgi:hypothetical protein
MNETLGCSKQAAIENYLKLERELYQTICFLKNLGGSELYFNDFKDAIIRLEGINRGLKLAEYHQELIETERRRKNL